MRNARVIRSDKYLGDIGEYICKELYDIALNKSGREKGYDGIMNNRKYEIKFHNSMKRTNIYFGDPMAYDYALVVLGPDSMLRPDRWKDNFLIYKFTNLYVQEHFQQDSGYCCGRNPFLTSMPDKTYHLHIN